MIMIFCTDDEGGIMFNHRRQSQDSVLRQRIINRAQGSRLFMSPYTARQFRQDLPDNAVVSEDFLSEAGPGDYCFIEDADPSQYAEKAEGIIVYRWNRDYPRDRVLPVDLTQWELATQNDFVGSSHDRITEEVFMRPGDA